MGDQELQEKVGRREHVIERDIKHPRKSHQRLHHCSHDHTLQAVSEIKKTFQCNGKESLVMVHSC